MIEILGGPLIDTLTMPPDTLSGTISVLVCSDSVDNEPDQTFFIDLSAPVNATIADSVGQGTIREFRLFVGGFDLSPDNARVSVDEVVDYAVVWTVPDGEVWRNLRTIDLRIRGGKTVIWVRWDEDSNTFSLCHKGGRDDGKDDEDEDEHGSGLPCGPGAAPGSAVVLETSRARLHLADSSVLGSGPTGPSVTLELGISFKAKAAGHSYRVELAATDDFGHRDDFVQAGTVYVERAHKHD